MRTMRALLLIVLVLAALALGSEQEVSTISGPTLGWIFDGQRHALRPVLGIPGAATLGEPLNLEFQIARAAVSPRQDLALVEVAGREELLVLRLPPETPSAVRIAGALAGAERVVFSPSGTAAALYSSPAARLQLLRRLADTPIIAADLDVSSLGELTTIAVSDDASVALGTVRDMDRDLLYLLPAAGGARLLTASGKVGALAFLDGRGDAILADAADNKIYLVRDVAGAAEFTVLATEADGVADPVAVAVSPDHRRVFIAGASGRIVAAALDGAPSQSLSCECTPSGLSRLNGDSVWRLTAGGAETMLLLDASAVPRVVFVPADNGGRTGQ